MPPLTGSRELVAALSCARQIYTNIAPACAPSGAFVLTGPARRRLLRRPPPFWKHCDMTDAWKVAAEEILGELQAKVTARDLAGLLEFFEDRLC